jgi:purine-binding chemotaxis protein CheW
MPEKLIVAEKQLVVFTLGEQNFGVDIALVREIIQMQPITRVPGTHRSVEGIINLRGSVIPTVDLRLCLHMAKVSPGKNTRIVVVHSNNKDVGVIVDSVAEVLRIPVDSIDSSSSLLTEEHLDHLQGIAKLSKRMVLLLDMDRVLCSRELLSPEMAGSRESENKSLAPVA